MVRVHVVALISAASLGWVQPAEIGVSVSPFDFLSLLKRLQAGVAVSPSKKERKASSSSWWTTTGMRGGGEGGRTGTTAEGKEEWMWEGGASRTSTPASDLYLLCQPRPLPLMCLSISKSHPAFLLPSKANSLRAKPNELQPSVNSLFTSSIFYFFFFCKKQKHILIISPLTHDYSCETLSTKL